MVFTPRRLVAISLVFLSFFSSGCEKLKAKPKPVVVHVLSNLRSPYGPELDHRIIEFQTTNPRTESGRPIVVQTVEIGDYKDMLEKHVGKDIAVQMVILDAPEDATLNPALQADLARAVNVCAALKACPATVPALIPSGTSGDELEGAQKFAQALQKGAPS